MRWARFCSSRDVVYVLGEGEWLSVAIDYALVAVLGHYALAVLMGYYYSVYHSVNHSSKVSACILLVPVATHSVYDALAMSGLVNIGGVSKCVLEKHILPNRRANASISKGCC